MDDAGDRMTSIPVHASTVRLLQQLKTGAQNWDDFLLSSLEDMLPPETERELEEREKRSQVRTFGEFLASRANGGAQKRKRLPAGEAP